MDLKKCQPVLFVKDAGVSSKFYTDVLGFTVIMENGGVNITFKEGFTVWQIWEGNIVGFSNAKIDISKNSNIPEADVDGRPDNFMRVYAESTSITPPKKWFSDNSGETSTLEIAGSNLLIGTGGISGTIGLYATNSGTIGAKDYLWKNIGGNNGFVK